MPFPLSVESAIMDISHFGAKSIFVVPDLFYLIRIFVPQHTADIKPQQFGYLIVLHVPVSGNCHELLLVFIHILLGVDIGKACGAGLHFHKHHILIVLGDDINLNIPKSPVAFHNLVPAILQVPAFCLFAKMSYIIVKRHGVGLFDFPACESCFGCLVRRGVDDSLCILERHMFHIGGSGYAVVRLALLDVGAKPSAQHFNLAPFVYG